MSRDLPPRPDLEYLKKQAKALLHTLKQREPDTLLADAQHALAREYGFASWPRLKAHVEGERAAPSPFVGAWTFDPSKSKLHPLNQLRSASLGFEVDGVDVTIDSVMVEASGRTDRSVSTLVADGTEHPSLTRDGFVLRARWLSSHTLEAVVSRNGEPEGRVKYAVSPDGHTLTLSASWRGGIDQIGVFTRAVP